MMNTKKGRDGMKSATLGEPDIARTLGIDQPSGHRRRLGTWLVIALLAIGVLIGIFITRVLL